MRKCLPVNSTIRLKLPEKNKRKTTKKRSKKQTDAHLFSMPNVASFRPSTAAATTANKRAQAIFCLRHARAKQKRRQTAASNKQANTAAATRAAVAVAVAQLQCVSCRYSISKIRICRAWPLRKA